jgi:hypothetical protein
MSKELENRKPPPTKLDNPEVWQQLEDIFDDYASTLDSLDEIIPRYSEISERSFFRWLRKSDILWQHYARAQEFRQELLVREHKKIANEPMPPMDMSAVRDKEVRLKALEWEMGKLSPKRFGTHKVEVESSGTVDVNVNHKLDKGQYEDFKNQVLNTVRETKFIQLPKEDIEDADYEDA